VLVSTKQTTTKTPVNAALGLSRYIMIKVIAFLILILVSIISLGLSGLLFNIWPTSFSDQELKVTPEVTEKLNKLLLEPKFQQNMEFFYPGAIDEPSRLLMEAELNDLLKTLIVGIKKNPNKSYILQNFKSTLSSFTERDSEDRDMLINYMDKVMSVLDVKSSNELLNVWRYGLPIGWVLKNA